MIFGLTSAVIVAFGAKPCPGLIDSLCCTAGSLHLGCSAMEAWPGRKSINIQNKNETPQVLMRTEFKSVLNVAEKLPNGACCDTKHPKNANKDKQVCQQPNLGVDNLMKQPKTKPSTLIKIFASEKLLTFSFEIALHESHSELFGVLAQFPSTHREPRQPGNLCSFWKLIPASQHHLQTDFFIPHQRSAAVAGHRQEARHRLCGRLVQTQDTAHLPPSGPLTWGARSEASATSREPDSNRPRLRKTIRPLHREALSCRRSNRLANAVCGADVNATGG